MNSIRPRPSAGRRRPVPARARARCACVLVAAAGAWANAAPARAAISITLTLTPERDNTLYEDVSGTLSNGAGPHLFAGATADGLRRRALLRFDLSTLPANATILSASLTLTMNRTITTGEPVSVHRLLADWGAAGSIAPNQGGGGDIALPGDATWIHRFSTTTTWTTPGGDFDASPSATRLISGNGVYTWSSTPALVADVQAWLAAPAGNFGWVLIGAEDVLGSAKRFGSAESATPPTLTIEFIPAPSAATTLALGLAIATRRRRGG